MGITPKELQDILHDNPDIALVDDGAALRYTYHVTPVAIKALVPTEEEEQEALFEWVDANMAAHEELKMLFHVPNGGYRPPQVGRSLRFQGVRRGVPDLMLAVPRVGYDGKVHCGLFIELKRVEKSKVSDEQKQWLENLRYYGYSAVICFGAAEAISVIQSYLAQEG